MNLVPNMFLINVSEIAAARAFYESLFDIEPAFVAPGFVGYPLGGGATLALQEDWQQPSPDHRPNTELVVNITASIEDFDTIHADWLSKGAVSLEQPHQEMYGYTFVVADPYGNRIRLAPQDDPQ